MYCIMASNRKINAQILRDAQRIIQDSLKVPQSSENTVAVSSVSSGALPVVVLPEDKRGLVILDEGVVLMGEPDLFAGNVDFGKGEASFVDPDINVGPSFSPSKLSSAGELEVGNVLAGAEVGSLSVEAILMPDVVFDVASREQSALGEDDDSEDDEESRKLGDLSCPSEQPFYFSAPPSRSVSKRRREVSRHDVAFVRGDRG